MAPRKRAVAEVHAEQDGEPSGTTKAAETINNGDVKSPKKLKKNYTKASKTTTAEELNAVKTQKGRASKRSDISEAEIETATKKSPRKSNGKKKHNEEVVEAAESKLNEKPEDKAEGGNEEPPKKKRASKKKAVEDDDTPRSLSAPPPGGSKMDTLASPELPTNMTIDDPLILDFVPKKVDTTRIMSWNVLSLNSSMKKGFMRYIEAEQADVAILTETKCNDIPLLPRLTEIYPHQTWGIGKTKGYAGIALLSKTKPLKVSIGMPDWDYDTKGRIITAEYERYIVIGTYVVNAGEGLKTLPQKQEWNSHFANHLAKCDARKPTIWTGDFNVVLDARDLSNASKKWDKSAGYTKIETDHHRNLLNGAATEGAKPFVDVWRQKHPDAVGHYTYYGFRGFCRSKGIGWRLDSHIVSERIADQVEVCEIRHSVYGASDHIPVFMDIKGSL